MKALLVEVLLGGDVAVEFGRNVLVDQHADAVQALEGHVGHLVGDRLAQHLLGAFFVGIIRRAQRYLDVRPQLGEFLDDALVGAFEQFGIGILNHDFGLGMRETGGEREGGSGNPCS